MTNTLDYYFATPSPWAYLATPRVIELKNKYNLNKNNYWIDPTKLQNYTLPTFTKKIVKFLENHK